MEQKEQEEQKEFEREVQAVDSEKADDPHAQTKSSDDQELSDNDLEQISGGLYNNNFTQQKQTNKNESLEERLRSY